MWVLASNPRRWNRTKLRMFYKLIFFIYLCQHNVVLVVYLHVTDFSFEFHLKSRLFQGSSSLQILKAPHVFCLTCRQILDNLHSKHLFPIYKTKVEIVWQHPKSCPMIMRPSVWILAYSYINKNFPIIE